MRRQVLARRRLSRLPARILLLKSIILASVGARQSRLGLIVQAGLGAQLPDPELQVDQLLALVVGAPVTRSVGRPDLLVLGE